MADTETTEHRVGRRDLLKYTGAGAAGVALAGCKSRPATETPGPRNTGTGTNNGPLSGRTFRIGVLAPTPKTFPSTQPRANGATTARQPRPTQRAGGGWLAR